MVSLFLSLTIEGVVELVELIKQSFILLKQFELPL